MQEQDLMAKTLMSVSSGIVLVAKTFAHVITDALQTDHHVNSSSTLCETLQRMAQLVMSVAAWMCKRKM
jgi:predicted histidine transporter YuiF (NhaC family)